jgi:hypothetical protein
MKLKQTIDNIFESKSNDWVMTSLDYDILYQNEMAEIKERIKNKFNVEYDPNNKKLKKIMDVRLDALKKRDRELINILYNNRSWTLTFKNNKRHLVLNESYQGAPIKGNFTWEIIGDFVCFRKNFSNLEGSPIKVTGKFICSSNHMTSLKGAPKYVGDNFDCTTNYITSLEGAPEYIGGSCMLSYNKLSNLEGAPKKIGYDFLCNSNELTSLKGCPIQIGRDFLCDDNKLTALTYGPKIVGGMYSCSENEITSLKGAPNTINGSFNFAYNDVSSLDGCPKVVNGDFSNKSNMHEFSEQEIRDVCDISGLVDTEHI